MAQDKLPEGWPTDADALTHAQLDDYGIPRKRGLKTLTLIERQATYTVRYLDPDDTPVPSIPPTAPPQPEPATRSGKPLIVAGVAALVVGIATAITLFVVAGSGPDPEDAWEECKAMTPAFLKSPGTAQFPDFEDVTYEQHGDDPDAPIYEMTYWVDAQNGYGATVRLDAVCWAGYVEGSDRWAIPLDDGIELEQRK